MTPPPTTGRPRVRDDVAYLLPMGAFLALTWAGGNWPATYPYTYTAKTLVAAALLWALWRHYTPPRWSHLGLGVLVGVVGVFQWVLMEKGLLALWPDYPRARMDPVDPFSYFDSPAADWAWIAVRLLGPALVVPVMEELFWRDFLWRSLLAPNDFKLAHVGEWDGKVFAMVAVFFAGVHLQMWATSVVWAVLVGWLLVRTRSLGACIVAHGVTNLLLGAYVLWTKDWMFW
ncbi:MAG TPA: CAAX prenyl protease-related protein [Tepidisphaeraceae bacterium]|nr:CAAX prenyl protease-related protein [Tepidisphaeraceae bacterium]